MQENTNQIKMGSDLIACTECGEKFIEVEYWQHIAFENSVGFTATIAFERDGN